MNGWGGWIEGMGEWKDRWIEQLIDEWVRWTNWVNDMDEKMRKWMERKGWMDGLDV